MIYNISLEGNRQIKDSHKVYKEYLSDLEDMFSIVNKT